MPNVEPDLVSHLDAQDVLRLLGQVDEQFQAAVALFYLEDYSYNEIAGILEIPLGTVKSRIARGLAQLKELVLRKARSARQSNRRNYMNSSEAKQILLLYRPGTADAADPQMAEALELARRDPELGRWFEQHRAFQKALRARFRQIEVPAHLKTSLLIQSRAPQPIIMPAQAWWRSPVWLTAAARGVALARAGRRCWLKPRRARTGLPTIEARMVSEAQREYRMDLVTNDMRQVRQFMAQRGAPADYECPGDWSASN